MSYKFWNLKSVEPDWQKAMREEAEREAYWNDMEEEINMYEEEEEE